MTSQGSASGRFTRATDRFDTPTVRACVELSHAASQRNRRVQMRLRYLMVLALAVAACALVSSAPAAPPEQAVSGTLEGSATGVTSFCTTGNLSVTGSFATASIGNGTYS